MRNEHFDVPVTIEGDKPGRTDVVADAVHAAETLLERWPEKERGPAYRAALKACMDVMEGRKQVVSARRAFVKAAKSAHVFVRARVPG